MKAELSDAASMRVPEKHPKPIVLLNLTALQLNNIADATIPGD